MKEDCGCSGQKDGNKPCTCGAWKKWLWIVVGISIAAGAGYYIWKKYRTA